MVPKAYLAKMVTGQDYEEEQCEPCEGNLDWDDEDYQESEWESDEDNFTEIDSEEDQDQGEEDAGSEETPAKCYVARATKRKPRQKYYDMGDLCWDSDNERWYDPFAPSAADSEYWYDNAAGNWSDDGEDWNDDYQYWEDEDGEEEYWDPNDPEATEDEDDYDDSGQWDSNPNNWPTPP